jgi:3-ketoacyl-CoA synthase
LLLQAYCCKLTAASLLLLAAAAAAVPEAGMSARDIDILVTTSSVFAPTPSVSSMLMNMFKMREDVQVSWKGGAGTPC